SKAYAMFRKEEAGQWHKQLLSLSEGEKTELTNLSLQALQMIQHNIAAETATTYFGATGRLVSKLEMPLPDKVDPQFLLTLLRAAKAPDPALSLKGVTAPLPLNDLLENFWSYFQSIKNDTLQPD